MRRKSQLGFGLGLGGGLSDTVVVLVIIGIFVAIVTYTYQDYRTLMRVGEAISSTASAKVAVEKTFEKNAADMSQLVSWVPPATGEYVKAASIARDGTITLLFTEKVAPEGQNAVQIVPVSGGKFLDLSWGTNAGRKFEWQCGGTAGKTTLSERYRPKDCR
jgi:type IV pilus assembly protein PilA